MASESIIPLVLVDAPDAPEIFTTFIAGAGPAGPDLVRLTFASSRANHSVENAPNNNVVNLRLVMSTPQVKGMIDFLQGYLASTQQAPIQMPPGETLQ